MNNAIFKAEYADFKLVKTRSTAQFVFEVPQEQAGAIMQMIGLPSQGEPQWFAIAKLVEEQKDTPVLKRNWNEISYPEQAGIMCNNQRFAEFIEERYPDEWALATTNAESFKDATIFWLRSKCGIKSRADIKDNTEAARIFSQISQEFRSWNNTIPTDAYEAGMR